VALAKLRRLRPAECRRGRPQRPRFHSGFSTFQCFAGRKSFPPAIFGASRPPMATRPTSGRDPGLRSDRELPPAVEILPRFSIYQCFASTKISLPLLSERRVRRWPCGRFRNEALLSLGAPGRPRARIPDVVAWRLPRPIPFSGPDSIFSSRCGAISGQLRPSLTMRPVSEQARCFHREGVRTARSRNGDRVRPSARSSWG
jgi:hypothetical protein